MQLIATLATDAASLMTAALAATPGPVTASDTAAATTLWDLTIKGGLLMIPIAICSLIAIAVAAERFASLRRSRVIPPGFVEGARRALSGGPRRALEYCRSHPSPIARVFEAGLRRWEQPLDHVERHITDAGLRESALLRRRLRALVVITAVTPLLGLLGTITGMIKAFRTVAENAAALGRTELLAGGIYEAMVTTAAGLIVAIPTLLLYHALAARVDGLVLEMDAACIDLAEERSLGARGACREEAEPAGTSLVPA